MAGFFTALLRSVVPSRNRRCCGSQTGRCGLGWPCPGRHPAPPTADGDLEGGGINTAGSKGQG